MNKKSIDKLLKNTNLIEQKAQEAHYHLEYIKSLKSINPKDYKPSERHEAEESLEHSENELIWALIEINKLTEEMIKKIDPEAWRER
jgi:hypothetical protein